MHDSGSSVPFTEPSGHNSYLIPIFFGLARACLWFLVFPSVLNNVPNRLSHIFFCLLHNQGERFKIISIIGHVLCVLLFMNGFMPLVLIVILIFLGSMVNSGFHESMFRHCVASVGCLIILASCLCFSLCHRNNSDSLFANQRFKRGMIGKSQNTFLGPPFLLFLLQFSSSPPFFLRLNESSPQIGHFSRSSYSGHDIEHNHSCTHGFFLLPNPMDRLSILPHKQSQGLCCLG
jgi:uncharacterized membrane protein